MSSTRLQGKIAVVTGGASGFGEGIALKFHQEGAKVIITDITDDLGAQTAKNIGCDFLKADATSREDWQRVLDYAVEKYGRLDIVVNNAGTSHVNKVCISGRLIMEEWLTSGRLLLR